MLLCDLVSPLRIRVSPGEFSLHKYYVGLEHIEKKTGVVKPSLTSDEKPSSAKTFFPNGALLFGKIRPELRKVGVSSCEGICSTDISVFIPVDEAQANAIALVLRSDRAADYFSSLRTGTSLPRVREDDILRFNMDWCSGHLLKELQELSTLLAAFRLSALDVEAKCRQLEARISSLL